MIANIEEILGVIVQLHKRSNFSRMMKLIHQSDRRHQTPFPLNTLKIFADSTLSAREINNGRLINPFDILLDTHRSFYLASPRNHHVGYGMKMFKEWVIDEMKYNAV